MVYPVTIYISKSSAARRFNIDRKTIQRKVKAGKLSQDAHGRIRRDELEGLLKAEEKRGRRGPRWSKPKTEPVTKGPPDYDPQRGFSKVPRKPNDAIVWNEKSDQAAVEKIKRQLRNLSSASLDEIAEFACMLSAHKKRLANLGHILPGNEILAALEIPSSLLLQKAGRASPGTKRFKIPTEERSAPPGLFESQAHP
jgi:hypothetical protein